MKYAQVLCFIVILLFCVGESEQQDTRNKIDRLPGWSSTIPFTQWSGYISVSPPAGRHLFYWFIESQSNPSTDPVVLWFTGGPGCSSLFALFTENGPFRVEEDGKTLKMNPYSWNKVANVIWVESPVGVGYSYSDDGTYVTGDTNAAQDNYAFITNWFELFSEFKSNPFFIAGESYAGHYVPQLANLLHIHKNQLKFKFEGFSVGNPSTDFISETDTYYSFLHLHGLISNAQYDTIAKACGAPYWYKYVNNASCVAEASKLSAQMNRINPYNIYAPCLGPWTPNEGCFTDQYFTASRGHDNNLFNVRSQTVIPCFNVTNTETYVASPELQKAIYVNTQGVKFPWQVCSSHLNYTQYAETVLPIYAELKSEKRILVYSGDVDSCVPFIGTETALDRLGLKVVDEWRAWFVDKQVAGYIKSYNTPYGTPGISYATVKNAGHMVPSYQPAAALTLFDCFINNKPFPPNP